MLNLNDKPVPAIIDVDDSAAPSKGEAATRSPSQMRPQQEFQPTASGAQSDNTASASHNAKPNLRLDPVNHPTENPIPKISDDLISGLEGIGNAVDDMDELGIKGKITSDAKSAKKKVE